MDLKAYYRRVREIEASLPEGDVLVASLATPDGGKAGVLTELNRFDAAKLMADGRARSATPEEISSYKQEQQKALQTRTEADLRNLVQLRLVNAGEFRVVQEPSTSMRRGSKGDQ